MGMKHVKTGDVNVLRPYAKRNWDGFVGWTKGQLLEDSSAINALRQAVAAHDIKAAEEMAGTDQLCGIILSAIDAAIVEAMDQMKAARDN